MRTTIDIEDDVLAAAKELARLQNVSAGQVVSRLVRQALAGPQNAAKPAQQTEKANIGFRPFPSRGVMVTDEQVNLLRDQEGV
ncbi:MAG TPA: CopG family transcriptional regulator [Gallionella sp.]|jgi:Arc/MetJ family transcription regulator|nr:CopG family transcriptional regulator [Gallionella sp.]